jgi:hypothetical protein
VPGGGTYDYTSGDPISFIDRSGRFSLSGVGDKLAGAAGKLQDGLEITGACLVGSGNYFTSSDCRQTVNGVVAATAVGGLCEAGTIAPTLGGSAGGCWALGGAAGAAAAGGTALIDGAFGRV